MLSIPRRSPWALSLVLLSVFAVKPARAQEPSPNLRPGDLVELRVWPDSSLGGNFRVEDQGIIYVPVIGVVPVAGRRVSEIRDEILTRLSVELQNPVVHIQPRFRVSLIGAVRGPGIFYIDPNTTLVDLIVQGGGLAEGAKPQDIRILRGNDVFRADVKAVFRGEGAGIDIPLQSGDRIVVPGGRRINWWTAFRTVLQITTLTFTLINRFDR